MFDFPGPRPQEEARRPPEHVLAADGTARGPAPGAAGRGGARGSVERGKVLFERYCSVCHGPLGTGRELTEDYPTPDLTEEDYLLRSDGDIYAVIVDGGLNMPSYRDALTEPDRWLVIRYLRTLQRSHAK